MGKLPSTSRHGGPRQTPGFSTLTQTSSLQRRTLLLGVPHSAGSVSQQLKQTSQNLLSGGPAEADSLLPELRQIWGKRLGAPQALVSECSLQTPLRVFLTSLVSGRPPL